MDMNEIDKTIRMSFVNGANQGADIMDALWIHYTIQYPSDPVMVSQMAKNAFRTISETMVEFSESDDMSIEEALERAISNV